MTIPSFQRTVTVNAPIAWPNSSLASNSSDSVGQLTTANGPLRRAL